jgi:predicted O-linked N-acetylglucosamine transferase (SPINDLY family)
VLYYANTLITSGTFFGEQVQPVLTAHNRDYCEVFCYSSVANCDDITERLKTFTDQWRDTAILSDKIRAELIRKDRIDILYVIQRNLQPI